MHNIRTIFRPKCYIGKQHPKFQRRSPSMLLCSSYTARSCDNMDWKSSKLYQIPFLSIHKTLRTILTKYTLFFFRLFCLSILFFSLSVCYFSICKSYIMLILTTTIAKVNDPYRNNIFPRVHQLMKKEYKRRGARCCFREKIMVGFANLSWVMMCKVSDCSSCTHSARLLPKT